MTIPPYDCQVCGRSQYRSFRPALKNRPCKCGENHWTCKKCWSRHARVVGEFPNWNVILSICPTRKENDGEEKQER